MLYEVSLLGCEAPLSNCLLTKIVIGLVIFLLNLFTTVIFELQPQLHIQVLAQWPDPLAQPGGNAPLATYKLGDHQGLYQFVW